MRVEVVDNELRALRASLARDGVHTLGFETNPTGLTIKINQDMWEPIGTVVKADEPQRFPYVGGAKVLAHFYDETGDRFVILADKGHGVEPFVVAYAESLTASEWSNGLYFSAHGNAASRWFDKVNEAVDANDIRPTGPDPLSKNTSPA